MYRCRICDREFETIPDTAFLLNHRGRNRVYRFMDGTVHDLIHGRALHKRCHKTMKVAGCEFCFPPSVPESPKEETELLQSVAQVLAELPTTQPEIKPEPEIEIEESLTSMEFEFRKA
jgi:hypothetical protein